MGKFDNYWENQKSNDSGNRCIATSRFIAGKLLGFFRNTTFRTHSSSALFRAIEEYRLKRTKLSATELAAYVAKYPNTYLSYLINANKVPVLPLRKLWNSRRSVNATEFSYLLRDAVWDRAAGVSRFPKVATAAARVAASATLGGVRPAAFVRKPLVQELKTHKFDKASRLLAQGTAMVATMENKQRHILVLARTVKESKIWFIEPDVSTGNPRVAALDKTSLYRDARPPAYKPGEGVSPWPSFYYYKINGALCKLKV